MSIYIRHLWLLALGLSLNFNLYSQSLEWVKVVNSASSQRGMATSVDDVGNVYTVGRFDVTSDFDPGPDTFNLEVNKTSIYLQKLDANGNFKWAKVLGNAVTTNVEVDDAGNIYTAVTLIENQYSLQIEKFDPNGNSLWKHVIATVSGFQRFERNLSVDFMGNVIIGGYFVGTIDFDPGPGVANRTSTGYANALSPNDVFILKLDTNGNFIWVKTLGSAQYENLKYVTSDFFGGIYLLGEYQGTLDLDPGAGTHLVTATGVSDVYLVKLDNNGNYAWGKNIGSSAADCGYSLATSFDNSVYVAGKVDSNVDFDPAIGSQNILSGYFIAKYDENGNYVNAKPNGGLVHNMAIDWAGNIFTVGEFNESADFNPGVGIKTLTSDGQNDIFVQKLDMDLNFAWAEKMGGTANDVGADIDVDFFGDIYLTGYYFGTANLYPGPAIVKKDGQYLNAFVQKLRDCTPQLAPAPIIATACDTYTYKSQTYTESGTYTQIFKNQVGCDSILTLHITINNSSQTTFTYEVACGSDYTFPDGFVAHQINDTVFHRSILKTVQNCDSIIDITLTTNPVVFHQTDSVTVCAGNNYTFADGTTVNNIQANQSYTSTFKTPKGCDSLITTRLFINYDFVKEDSVCIGNSYTFPDGTVFNTITQDTTHTSVFRTQQNCGDSTIITQVRLYSLSDDRCMQTIGEGTHQANNVYGDQWFKYIASRSEKVFISTCGLTNEDTGIILYNDRKSVLRSSGADACGKQSHLRYDVIAGNVYYIRFSSAKTQGQYPFKVGFISDEVAQTCNDAIAIGACNRTITHLGTNQWVKYTAPANGVFKVSTCNTTEEDTWIKAYSNCDSTPIAESDDDCGVDYQSEIILNVQKGQTYFIEFDAEYFQYLVGTYPVEISFTYANPDDQPTADTVTIQSCDQYVLGNKTLTTSGFYTHSFKNALGCDSTVVINLNILASHQDTTTVTTCNSYTWQGQTYNNSGLYSKTFTNQAGCDSVKVLRLTITPPTNDTITVQACEAYTWQGEIYNKSGVYTKTFLNQGGCDSVRVLKLSITNFNVQVSQENNTLIATVNNAIGVKYQWIDCGNNNQLIKDTNSSRFSPAQNGNYAVIVNNGTCIDTSACIAYVVASTHPVLKTSLKIYPNPTTDILQVHFEGKTYSGVLKILDITGAELRTIQFTQQGHLTLNTTQGRE